MSASASQSKTDQYSAQTSVQGASGAQSPTVTAGNNVSYSTNDPTIALSAISAAGNAITAALAGAGKVTQQSLAALTASGASQSDSNAQILQQALAAEQQLAAAQGTGGASMTSQSNNYLIFGAIGVAVLAVVALIFGRRSA